MKQFFMERHFSSRRASGDRLITLFGAPARYRGILRLTAMLASVVLTQGIWVASLQAQMNGVAIAPVTVPLKGARTGELLLGELNCTACHQASDSVKARLFPKESPRLGQAGLRLTPQYLRAFLADPGAEKPGTTMPDVLHGISGPQRAEAVDALIHFLVWLNETNPPVAVSANQTQILRGRLLYHQVGCVACHAPQESVASLNPGPSIPGSAAAPTATQSAPFEKASSEKSSIPLGNLAMKTTVLELARFLMNPLAVRPSGRMPSLNLNEGEATAIGMYLLRDQAAASAASHTVNRSPGLDYQYYEGSFSDTTKLDGAKPKANGLVEQFSLKPRKRTTNIGFQFSGLLTIPADGNYTFYASSDDGTRLYVDDQLVVDNDGIHGTTEKKGSLRLTAGDHPIRVSYFDGGAETTLKISYEGPGLPKQEIPPTALSHQWVPMAPLEDEQLVVDPEKANRGKDLFASLGCAACHELGSLAIASSRTAKPLVELDIKAAENCLNSSSQHAPQYGLNDAQRESIKSALNERPQWAQPLAPQDQAARLMAALNCFACHSRDGSGGPTPQRAEYFTIVGGADLGDEGRIPPHLTRVGDKLRPEWLREVLLNKGTSRPYMATRMPQFGQANVAPVLSALIKADSSAKSEAPPEPARPNLTSPAAAPGHNAGYGRKLVGTEGFSCISCHLFAQHKSLGIPAMDLTMMTRRLKKDWFHQYLLDPPSLRPGTRMPTFWPEGKSARKEILDADTDRQIDAIWAYLSLGKEAGLPPGLVQGKMELVASNEAVIYRNFIQGAGPRAIGVGYPEKANLAFDANDLRLALIWQGPFIDAARHRNGRGDGFEGPLGYNVLKMPAGSPFAVLSDTTSKWPEAAGKKAGYQMRGYRLDAKRRPAFLYSFQNVHIEDYPVAVSGDLDASFRRTLTLQADHAVENLWFRAWTGSKIEAQSDGSFLAEGKIKLQFQLAGAAKPIIRQLDGKSELLVPVNFNGAQASVVEEIVW